MAGRRGRENMTDIRRVYEIADNLEARNPRHFRVESADDTGVCDIASAAGLPRLYELHPAVSMPDLWVVELSVSPTPLAGLWNVEVRYGNEV